jgi:hypothetical protein
MTTTTDTFAVLIHDFAAEDNSGDYIALTANECRDSVDREVYELAVMFCDSIRMGSVMAIPSTEPDFESLTRDI